MNSSCIVTENYIIDQLYKDVPIMKSTQDLTIWLRELSLVRDIQCIVVIYPNKSFSIQEYTPESNNLDEIYASDAVEDGIDINDLPYEDVGEFNEHINELAQATQLLMKSSDPNGLEDI